MPKYAQPPAAGYNDNTESLPGGGLGAPAFQHTHDPFSSEAPIGHSNMNGANDELQHAGSNLQNGSLIQLISGLNQSVKQLAQRFDKFQDSIESKINKMHGEIVILKNRVDVLEHNVKPQGTSMPGASSLSTKLNNFPVNNFSAGIEGESISARGDNDYQDHLAPQASRMQNPATAITAQNLALMNEQASTNKFSLGASNANIPATTQ